MQHTAKTKLILWLLYCLPSHFSICVTGIEVSFQFSRWSFVVDFKGSDPTSGCNCAIDYCSINLLIASIIIKALVDRAGCPKDLILIVSGRTFDKGKPTAYSVLLMVWFVNCNSKCLCHCSFILAYWCSVTRSLKTTSLEKKKMKTATNYSLTVDR